MEGGAGITEEGAGIRREGDGRSPKPVWVTDVGA